LWKTPTRENDFSTLSPLEKFSFSQDRLTCLLSSPPFQPFISIFPFSFEEKSNFTTNVNTFFCQEAPSEKIASFALPEKKRASFKLALSSE